MTRILIPALNLESSLSAIRLAELHPSIYAAVGFHPTDLDTFSMKTFEDVKNLANQPKVVAVGEIGIDYYWVKKREERAFQLDVLRMQLDWAASIYKPVIIHMREEEDAWIGQASIDLIRILTEWHKELVATNHPLVEKPGVLHSFNGNLETAQKAIAMNFYIGVTGPVTYKNADQKRNIIEQIPITKLLIETDAPFLTPVPHRGKRNEPGFVIYIADKIAEIHRTTREQVSEMTAMNAAHLFGWEADA